MIKISFLEKDSKIIKIEAQGHALFAQKGKDIVCSAVSAILVGGCNALENHSNYDIKIESGNLAIDTLDKITEQDEIVMRTIIIQLKTIEESYSSYLKVFKKM